MLSVNTLAHTHLLNIAHVRSLHTNTAHTHTQLIHTHAQLTHTHTHHTQVHANKYTDTYTYSRTYAIFM